MSSSCVILFAVVFWLALVYWTFADARRRIADPILIGCATVASLFPYVGTLIYMVVRPPEYLDDVHERELEIQAAEARIAESAIQLCPYCDHVIEKDFLRCPTCLRKLKDACVVVRHARWIPTGRSARTARPRSAAPAPIARRAAPAADRAADRRPTDRLTAGVRRLRSDRA